MLKRISLLLVILSLGVVGLFAQQEAQTRNVPAGQKMKLKGAVVAMDNGSFIIRDVTGVDTRIVVSPNASIKSNSFWGSGESYPATAIVRGLLLEAEGRGDNMGALAATKIRFNKSNLDIARSIDTRVSPAEERITATEQNAQRISGQIDELMAISNAARGGAKAAQETADAAVAGVNATNQRISALDDYVVQSDVAVNFRVGSAVLSPEAKAQLDEVAATAMMLRGFMIEVTGFASSDGNAKANKTLSERRAKAVKDYLIEMHNIPLRRMTDSYGFGEGKSVADNATREGREQNRRVEVKVLVSRGLNQNVEVRSSTQPTN